MIVLSWIECLLWKFAILRKSAYCVGLISNAINNLGIVTAQWPYVSGLSIDFGKSTMHKGQFVMDCMYNQWKVYNA